MMTTFSDYLQVAFTALAAGIIYIVVRNKLFRSPLDNVPGPKADSWLFGDMNNIWSPNAWGFHDRLAKKYGQVATFQGLFGSKALFIHDPKALQSVFVKDQHIFEETDGFIYGNRLMFGFGLLGTLGDQHRKQRKMLTPVFSVAHLRDMMPVFHTVVTRLHDTLKNKIERGSPVQEIDMLSWMGRTALELIGQSGLGFSFDPLEDDESTAHPYSKIIKDLFPTATRLAFIGNNLVPAIGKLFPPAFGRFLANITPSHEVKHMRDMTDYMWSLATEIYEEKKRALEKGDEVTAEQVGMGKDVLSILMRANMNSSASEKLEEYEVIGQISTLVFAAMDTTSSAMARMLHLLATHPEVQKKLRKEIIDARENRGGEPITHDELIALPYLDAVCRETLRLYPSLPRMNRVARADTVLPLSTPITGVDGTELNEILVPAGTSLVISNPQANMNPALWGPNAEQWRPERWLEPLPEALVAAKLPGVYSHLMTFAAGSRSCIGFKFSQLEMKIVMSTLLQTLEFTPSEKESKLAWQMNIVISPVIGDDPHPQLPLNVSLVKSE